MLYRNMDRSNCCATLSHAKTDKAAEKASLLGISLTVPIWTIFMFIGTALFVFYVQNELPPGMKGRSSLPALLS
jgi:hypothetical protein